MYNQRPEMTTWLHLETRYFFVAGIELLLQLLVACLQRLNGCCLIHPRPDLPRELRIECCEAEDPRTQLQHMLLRI